MGDRALVIFTDGEGVSPVVYLHWHGSEVKEWLKEHREMMRGRLGDISYSTARFIGLAHSKIEGNLSLGCWNVPKEVAVAVKNLFIPGAVHTHCRQVLREYSHGDAGVVIVDVSERASGSVNWFAFGGYLASKEECGLSG